MFRDTLSLKCRIPNFVDFLLDLISYCVFAASAVSAKIAEEIKKLEDNQNALQWFNVSYWFPGGIQTRINSIEQQVVAKEKQILEKEKQITVLLGRGKIL